jgi:hypothetical protein
MAELGQATNLSDLVEFSEVSIGVVKQIMNWGVLLGIIKREGADYWRLDDIVQTILHPREECQ